MANVVAFIHIPKCGGITMREIIRERYRPDEVYFKTDIAAIPKPVGAAPDGDNKEPLKYKFVYGHFPFDRVPPGAFAFTMLRNPVDRLISYYRMTRRASPHEFVHYPQFWQDNVPMSLMDFARNALDMRSQLDNAMVRQLHSYALLVANRPVQPQEVEESCQHLDSIFFGLTERYEDSLTMLYARLGWGKPPRYAPQNVSVGDFEVTAAERAEIAALNWGSMELYQWALGEFERRWQEFQNA